MDPYMRMAKRVYRELSKEEEVRLAKLREKIDCEEKDEILAQGRRFKAARDAAIARLREAVQLLRAERTRQGLSLAEMQIRTGIAPSALSRLETDADANPTLATLERYANALGKQLHILLADKAHSA
jgi:hypothetical protein